MRDDWRDRAFSFSETARVLKTPPGQLHSLIHRNRDQRFSERRKGRRWFSSADIAALAIAERARKAGMPCTASIAAGIAATVTKPAADAAMLLSRGKVAAMAFDFDEAARLAVEEGLAIVPAGRIAADVAEACENIRQKEIQ